jgi:hypothetical protein
MQDRETLFVVTLPSGVTTIPYAKAIGYIGEAIWTRKHGPLVSKMTSNDELAMHLMGYGHDPKLRKAVDSGEVAVMDGSFVEMTPPLLGDAISRSQMRVSEFRKFVEMIGGAVEVRQPAGLLEPRTVEALKRWEKHPPSPSKGKSRSIQRAHMLSLRQRIQLDEAPYIVIKELGGGDYNDALQLVLDAIDAGRLTAEVVPVINQWTGEEAEPIDVHRSSIGVADLSAWAATLPKLPSDAEVERYPLMDAVNELAMLRTLKQIDAEKAAPAISQALAEISAMASRLNQAVPPPSESSQETAPKFAGKTAPASDTTSSLDRKFFPTAPQSIEDKSDLPPYPLAIEDELSEAFDIPPEDQEMFDQGNIPDLVAARKRKGSRWVKRAYDPYLFMLWFVHKSMCNKRKTPPLSEADGWGILKDKFPDAYLHRSDWREKKGATK